MISLQLQLREPPVECGYPLSAKMLRIKHARHAIRPLTLDPVVGVGLVAPDSTGTHGHAPALTVPRAPNSTSATAVDADARWRLARRLLHDEDFDPADRVAGILVVLYAQPVARIARLRASDVRLTDDRDTLLRLARDELLMPEPLGSLVRRLPHRRQHGASATLLEDPWLFPGRQAGPGRGRSREVGLHP